MFFKNSLSSLSEKCESIVENSFLHIFFEKSCVLVLGCTKYNFQKKNEKVNFYDGITFHVMSLIKVSKLS